jgi:hypothetical protein
MLPRCRDIQKLNIRQIDLICKFKRAFAMMSGILGLNLLFTAIAIFPNKPTTNKTFAHSGVDFVRIVRGAKHITRFSLGGDRRKKRKRKKIKIKKQASTFTAAERFSLSSLLVLLRFGRPVGHPPDIFSKIWKE